MGSIHRSRKTEKAVLSYRESRFVYQRKPFSLGEKAVLSLWASVHVHLSDCIKNDGGCILLIQPSSSIYSVSLLLVPGNEAREVALCFICRGSIVEILTFLNYSGERGGKCTLAFSVEPFYCWNLIFCFHNPYFFNLLLIELLVRNIYFTITFLPLTTYSPFVVFVTRCPCRL